MSDIIKFATPDIGEAELSRIKDAIDSRWIANGPKVREFERRIAQMSGCERAVAFDSCTSALEMALRVLGVGPGDEVITTPYTYTSTAEAIFHVGAEPVFVDLAPGSFEMNYDLVAEAITRRTKAIIPVDIGGKLCDYDALYHVLEIMKSSFRPKTPLQEAIGRVAVVEDAAHSFGAISGNKVCGQFADFTCFSFHVLKNITTGGEGGAVAWRSFPGVDNADIETSLRMLGHHGRIAGDNSVGWEYDVFVLGYNSIMTDIDAAMGLAQLDRYDEILAKRIVVTANYDELFAEVPFIIPLIDHFGLRHMSAMHLYPIRLPGNGKMPESEYRNEVYLRLKAMGIPCNVHYKPLPMMTAYKALGYDIKEYPEAYDMFASLLTIPYHTDLTKEQQVRIVEGIRKVVLELE